MERIKNDFSANNFTEFIEKILRAETRVFNTTDNGQAILQGYLAECIKTNPSMTPEQWKTKKSDLLLAILWLVMNEDKTLKKEMAGHLYRELTAE